MMPLLYNTGIFFYHLMIRVGSLFNAKARLWIKGRKHILQNIAVEMDSSRPVVWFHAASLGEFEQGRPVIESFRDTFPNHQVLLTFFSPSGYEIRKNYAGADCVFYLPIDSRKNAQKFLRIVKPQLVIFIKYEFWFNYIREIRKNNIPLFVISSIFRPEQHFFKWYGGWFRKQLRLVSLIFVQNENSQKLLKTIGINNVKVSGDTRFDRVATIASLQKTNAVAESFSSGAQIILGGSTWPADETLLAEYLKTAPANVKMIIAPHEIHEEHLQSIETQFKNIQTTRYSTADQKSVKDSKVLIIDGIGFLSSLYRYAVVAYIGGGFGKGIHNILEAVTFGKPVVFGPQYRKFSEAVQLIEKGGAFAIRNNNDLNKRFDLLLKDQELYQNASSVCQTFIAKNKGATEMILHAIKSQLKK